MLFRSGKDNSAITIEKQIENIKMLLLNEISFDLDKYLILGCEESKEYLSTFVGFNVDNIELLADLLFHTVIDCNFSDSNLYIEKTLQLYNFCNLMSKTFSLEREAKIIKIKERLQVLNVKDNQL